MEQKAESHSHKTISIRGKCFEKFSFGVVVNQLFDLWVEKRFICLFLGGILMQHYLCMFVTRIYLAQECFTSCILDLND